MIIDIHSHVWEYPDHFGDDFRRQAAERARVGEELDLTVRYEDYCQSIPDGEQVQTGQHTRTSGLVSSRWIQPNRAGRTSFARGTSSWA